MDDKDGPKRSSLQSSSALGLCDDSEAKLANQDEEFKLLTAVDTLHSAKHRRKTDIAHDNYELRKKLISLKSQRNLLDKARAENIFKTKDLHSKSPKCYPQTEPRVTFADQIAEEGNYQVAIAEEGNYQVEELQSDSLNRRKTSVDIPLTVSPDHELPLNRERSYSIPPDVSATNHKMTLTRKTLSAPVIRSTRGSSKKPHTKESSTRDQESLDIMTLEDLESEGGARLYNLRWKSVATSEIPASTQLPSVQQNGARPRTASSVQQNGARQRTASAPLSRGRSRRELYQLTHIDPITAADMAWRRKMWFSQLEQNREVEEAKLQCKIKDFIGKVEADKKKLRRTTGMDSLFGTEHFLKI